MEQAELKLHRKFLKKAVKMAEKGMLSGKGGPFGAVIVKDGKIIARGCNQVTSTNDPTRHAEVDAIRKACRKLKDFELKDCIIYSSCEPCPMCLALFIGLAPKRSFLRQIVRRPRNTVLTMRLFIMKSLFLWRNDLLRPIALLWKNVRNPLKNGAKRPTK